MALDGGFTYNLVAELQAAVGSHIDKMHQPSRHELVLSLRSNSGAKRLLISAVSGKARIHFTETRPENPEAPPTFCMLMRKYFGNARITEIKIDGLERIVKITASLLNEMGDIIYPCIYAELIGAAPNIIMVLDGKIIDAVRRSSLENAGRIVLPGAGYELPERAQKFSPLTTDSSLLLEKVLENKNKTLQSSLLETVEGLSPVVCREIAFCVGKDVDFQVKSVTQYHKKLLKSKLESVISDIKKGRPQVITLSGKPIDFSYTEITQYGKSETLYFDSFCSLLDEYYSKQAANERISHAAGDILKLITNAFSRAERRKNQRTADLKKTEDREKLRFYGELIKSNIHLLNTGQTSATVQNYYDENLATVKIPLDPALSPAANAAKYFKNYKKACVASQTLVGLIEEDTKEIEYLDSVLDSLSRAESIADIGEIREELALAGYIRRPKGVKPKNTVSAPLEFISPSGYTVLVGKNNRQNDLLTLHIADKNDMWFHTKNIAGSHTVLRCAEKEITDADIIFAAQKAAEHSKAKSGSGVAVDYTRIKFVKKPAGAKAGMVIFSKNQTVFVTPEIK
ncbi:MAG: NFACT family protein [Clostridiales bacterium]|nr:NFACT family protein [Candidatus Equinaster intestinalis]